MELNANFTNLGHIQKTDKYEIYGGLYSPSHFLEILKKSLTDDTLLYSKDFKKVYVPWDAEGLYIEFDMTSISVKGITPKDAVPIKAEC